MSKTMSIFLDALRFVAALVVVFGHLTQPAFTSIGPDDTYYAIAAVAVFFVLSGFVISYVVADKETTALDYAAARIARIQSVLVPAVLLSALALYVGIKLDPAYMLHWVPLRDLHPLARPLVAYRLFEHSVFPVTLLNVFRTPWREAMYPPLDSPIWALTYEIGYYILFGVAVFGRGVWRVLLLLALLVLMGPEVLRLAPVWFAGVLLQRVTVRWQMPRGASVLLGTLCFAGFAAAFFCWQSYTAWINLPHSAFLYAVLHGHSGNSFTAWIFYYWGVATCLLILGVFLLEEPIGRVLMPMQKPIRWCAGRTFSIYLFHFPVLVLLYAATHYDRSSVRDALAVFAVDVLLCMLLATVGEERKLWWRRSILRLLRRIFPNAQTAS